MKPLLLLVLSLFSMVQLKAQNEAISASFQKETAFFSVYPNPSINGNFNIKTRTDNPSGTVDLYVLNVLGQPVYHEKINADSKGNIEKAISVNTLPAGLYFVKIDDNYTQHDIIRLRID